MSHFYINYVKGDGSGGWKITETNEDRTQEIVSYNPTSFEINVPVKSFISKHYYIYCTGNLSWDGAKAIINPAVE